MLSDNSYFLNKDLLNSESLHCKYPALLTWKVLCCVWRNITDCCNVAESSGVSQWCSAVLCSISYHGWLRVSHRHPTMTTRTCVKETPVLQSHCSFYITPVLQSILWFLHSLCERGGLKSYRLICDLDRVSLNSKPNICWNVHEQLCISPLTFLWME